MIFVRTLFVLLITSGNLFSQQPVPLSIPPSLSGATISLAVQEDSVQFLPGTKTRTYGINQAFLGPTLILNAGEFVQLNVINQLADTTTMHWHGLHVASADDGGPHTTIAPGTTWSPDFTLLDEASTFWYHPHLHEHTAEQVYLGAAGMIIIHDSLENSLGLPNTYGTDDFPIIIQDKSFDSLTNQLFFEAMSDTIMINGTLNPYLEVPAQMVRFRFLNGSNQRVYNLGLPVGISWLIAGDGGLLDQPLPLTRMQIAPGERAEVIVDFSGMVSTNLPLIAFNSEMGDGVSGGPGGPGGGPGNPLDGNDFPLLEFRVVSPTANAVMSLAGFFRTYNIPDPQSADVYRVKSLTVDSSGFPFYINGRVFDMDYNNDTVMLGDTEIWEIRNETDVAHPLHIHDIQFHVIELNGNFPPGHLRGRKDVILLEPGDTVKFITKFEDFSDEHTPYMYHCHNLFHEDGGMMAQFIVIDDHSHDSLSSDPGENIDFYPNPAEDWLSMEDYNPDGSRVSAISVWDARGCLVAEISIDADEDLQLIDLSTYAPGLYFFETLHQNGTRSARRILRQ